MSFNHLEYDNSSDPSIGMDLLVVLELSAEHKSKYKDTVLLKSFREQYGIKPKFLLYDAAVVFEFSNKTAASDALRDGLQIGNENLKIIPMNDYLILIQAKAKSAIES